MSQRTRSGLVRTPPIARKFPNGVPPPPTVATEPSFIDPSPEKTPSLPSKNVVERKADDSDVMKVLLELRGMIAEVDNKISTKVDALSESLDAIRKEIKEDLITRIDENQLNIASHSQRFDQVEEAISELRIEAEVASKAADLVVKGIPMNPGESTVGIYLNVAKAIGFPQECIPQADTFRLGRRKEGAKMDPPLLFKFTNVIDKTLFHRRYFQHKNLNLHELGFASSSRVFITEILAKKQQGIFTAAMKLRNEKALHSVSTSRGVVFKLADN